ncbi:efflux RND transporter periplasmic adaptor subunit [Tahibacter caeni]|uniref:efflux RND transporter periplasmic adaptor subunit n=1 Tax=Tahibacter caeni TaxID=1453545 RepID=UPI002147D36E|nr:efflux RND transporter periplasmic adaptor subunit [Tahibacter caeni]
MGTTPAAELESLLGTAADHRRRRVLVVLLALALAAAVAYGVWSSLRATTNAPLYQTAEATRGDITVSVTATGNLKPTTQVDVGSELSGIIESVAVDANVQVRSGQVLARLDTARLRDQAEKSRSAVTTAQAQTRLAEATAREAELALQRLRGIARLSAGKLPAAAELDAAEAALERARAAVAGAAADTLQARAALHADETSLAKASIRSPIDGVVLTRKIEPGQTVAASLQAPVLFTIAQTLSQMELDVDVDEADVGGVREGMEATFAVDAYPARTYRAHVRRVDLGSQVKDGVVSYVTVLDVDNTDLSLRPGMTATAEIVTATVRGAVLVPSAALRFQPEEQSQAQGSGSLVERLLPRMPRATTAKSPRGAHQVWILRDGAPQAVDVVVGASDGQLTEIVSGLAAGTRVITETAAPP